jgi:hypothetical protein
MVHPLSNLASQRSASCVMISVLTSVFPHAQCSTQDSFYMNAISDNVKDPKTLLPGQINVTQEQFEDISVAAVTELWSKYGDLAEIW